VVVDATDLDRRARTRSGCIPPELVVRLLEQGHADVVEVQAGRGEWFCALAWARVLGEQGRQAEALEVLGPYLATGWWAAVTAAAELLEGWGRAGEAIEITRVRMEAGHPTALEFHTRLLARHGRAEEAFALLVPYADDRALATALVDVAGIARRDEEAIAVMRAQADARNGDDWILHALSELCLDQGRPAEGLAHLDALAARRKGAEEWDLFWMRLPLIAACGGVDEAVERARAHPEGATWYAAEHIARLLAGAGRTEEAVTVLQQHDRRNSHDLAGHLIDLGRIEEALAVLQHTSPSPSPVPTAHPWSDEPPF
jgi:hypothetical protein